MTLTAIRSGRLVVGVFAGSAALSAVSAHANTIPADRVPTNDLDSFSLEAAVAGQGDQAAAQTQSTAPQSRLGEAIVSPEWLGADAYTAVPVTGRGGRYGVPIHDEGWCPPAATPEPASLILTGTGLVMLALRRRRP
jgi:hypothetical protein